MWHQGGDGVPCHPDPGHLLHRLHHRLDCRHSHVCFLQLHQDKTFLTGAKKEKYLASFVKFKIFVKQCQVPIRMHIVQCTTSIVCAWKTLICLKTGLDFN